MAKKQTALTKEDLERDKELDLAEYLYFLARTHANKIFLALAVIFLLYAVSIFLYQREEARLAAASDALFEASLAYQQALSQTRWGTEERRDGMQEAITLADRVIEEYGDTPTAENALFLKGNAQFFAGDPQGQTTNTERAIATFTEYLNRVEGDGDPFKTASALIALAYAQENAFILRQGQDADLAAQSAVAAERSYLDVMEMEDAGFLRYEAMLALGRLYEARDERDRARELYERVLLEHFQEPEPPAEDASRQQALIYELKVLSNQFTLGNRARIQLRRLGVDPDELLEQAGGGALLAETAEPS